MGILGSLGRAVGSVIRSISGLSSDEQGNNSEQNNYYAEQKNQAYNCNECSFFSYSVEMSCNRCNFREDNGRELVCTILRRAVDRDSRYCIAASEGLAGGCSRNGYTLVDRYNGVCSYGKK